MNPNHTSFNRRDFLKTSALVGAGATAIANRSLSQTRTPGGAGETWFDKPMRWAQLVGMTLAIWTECYRIDAELWCDCSRVDVFMHAGG